MCRPPFWEHFLFEFVATYLVRWSISRRPRVNPWLAIMESEQCFWKPIRDWHLARRNLQKLQVVEGQKAAAGSRGERMFSWGENFDSLAGGFLELGRRGSFEEEDEVADEQHGWTPKQLLSLVCFLFLNMLSHSLLIYEHSFVCLLWTSRATGLFRLSILIHIWCSALSLSCIWFSFLLKVVGSSLNMVWF